MNRKESIKAITEAGVFTAIYILLAIITRYLLTGTDSMLYYIYPVPLAIYTVRNKKLYAVMTTFAIMLLSFLFVNPINVAMLIIPNLIIGLVFGLVEVNQKNKLFNYIIIFLICLIADFLSVYAFEIITGVDYWQDTIDLMAKLFPYIESEIVINLIKALSVAVLIIDSVIKCVFIYLVFGLISMRLKLIPDYTFKATIKLKYHFLITIIYLLLTILVVFLTNILITSNYLIIEIIHILVISCWFLLGCYLLYQFVMYLKIKLYKIKNCYFVIIILISFLLFPISIVGALILNLINFDKFIIE